MSSCPSPALTPPTQALCQAAIKPTNVCSQQMPLLRSAAVSDLHQGCVTQAWLAVSEDELAQSTGGYFYQSLQPSRPGVVRIVPPASSLSHESGVSSSSPSVPSAPVRPLSRRGKFTA